MVIDDPVKCALHTHYNMLASIKTHVRHGFEVHYTSLLQLAGCCSLFLHDKT